MPDLALRDPLPRRREGFDLRSANRHPARVVPHRSLWQQWRERLIRYADHYPSRRAMAKAHLPRMDAGGFRS